MFDWFNTIIYLIYNLEVAVAVLEIGVLWDWGIEKCGGDDGGCVV